MTNLILCILLQVLFHPSDSSRTWQNSSNLEPAYVYKKRHRYQMESQIWYTLFLKFLAFMILERKSTKKMLMYVAKCTMHNCTRRTWAIQWYRELLKLIDESMESSVLYYGVTSMYITSPKSASSRHILAITFMIQKLYDTHFMVGFCLIMYKYSYKNYVNGNKVFGLRYSDFCSFLSEPLTFTTLKHLANPTSKPCRWRIALINHIFASLTDHFEIKSRVVLETKLW